MKWYFIVSGQESTALHRLGGGVGFGHGLSDGDGYASATWYAGSGTGCGGGAYADGGGRSREDGGMPWLMPGVSPEESKS